MAKAVAKSTSAKQAVSKAQPKQTKPTGVVPHSNRKIKTGQSKPIQPTHSNGRAVGKTPIKDRGKGIQPYSQKTNPYGTGSGNVANA